MPNRPSTSLKSRTVAPNTPAPQTTWSPALSRASAVARMAAMPELVATASSAPSSAASRSSNIRTVGLEKRE